MTAHVFDKKKRAQDFAKRKNKNARKYRWKIQPYYDGYIVHKVKK